MPDTILQMTDFYTDAQTFPAVPRRSYCGKCFHVQCIFVYSAVASVVPSAAVLAIQIPAWLPEKHILAASIACVILRSSP